MPPPPAGLTWAGLEWIIRGKPSVLGTCSGVVAGLVCITPASGYRDRHAGLADGRGGGLCLLPGLHAASRPSSATTIRWTPSACTAWAARWGRILTGVFATRATGATLSITGDKLLGLLEGGWVLEAQVVAVVITWVLAVVGTFVSSRCWTPRWACAFPAKPRSKAWTSASTAKKDTSFI